MTGKAFAHLISNLCPIERAGAAAQVALGERIIQPLTSQQLAVLAGCSPATIRKVKKWSPETRRALLSGGEVRTVKIFTEPGLRERTRYLVARFGVDAVLDELANF
jgi:hypothetical protein